MIETNCPHCGKLYRLKTELAGRKARCRNCSNTFLVPDDEFDDLDMVSVAIETYRPPARSGRGRQNSKSQGGIDFGVGHEADEDDEVEADFETARRSRQARPANRPPAWRAGNQPATRATQIPVWVMAGVPAALAAVALIFVFVVPRFRTPSVAEITGLPEEIIAKFEMAGDPPLGSPAPANMQPVVGTPTRDLSGNQLLFEDMISLMDGFRQNLSQVRDFPTMMVAIDWIEKEVRPRFLDLMEDQKVLPAQLTKKEDALMRDYYLRYTIALGKALDEIERIRKIPEAGELLENNEYFNQLRTLKEKFEQDIAKLDPAVDTRPEGNREDYAEIRVIGTDTPELKAYFEARLRSTYPLRYVKVHQAGSAPTRYAIWPIDNIQAVARRIGNADPIHITGREIWCIMKPMKPGDVQRDHARAIEDRKKNFNTTADIVMKQRAIRESIRQNLKNSDPSSKSDQPVGTSSSSIPASEEMPRSPGMRRSEEVRGQTQGSRNFPGIPSGASAGIGPVSESTSNVNSAITSSRSRTEPVSKNSYESKVDKNQLSAATGRKDAFDVALERIRDPLRKNDVEFGMAILLKIDTKGRETELFKALGPYLDSRMEDDTAVALAVLDRIEDPRRVEEVTSRLGKYSLVDPLFCGVLEKWNDPRAIQPLADQLDGFPLWKHFDNTLIAFGPAAEKAVIGKLAAAKSDTRKRACEILGQIGGDESLQVFAKLKPDSDPFVRMAANTAITNIRSRLGKPSGRRSGR